MEHHRKTLHYCFKDKDFTIKTKETKEPLYDLKGISFFIGWKKHDEKKWG